MAVPSIGVRLPSSHLPAAPLWSRLWRRPLFKRGFYEVLGLVLWRRKGLQLLNCGYADANYSRFPLPLVDEPERLGYQLYHRLVRDTPLAARIWWKSAVVAAAVRTFLPVSAVSAG